MTGNPTHVVSHQMAFVRIVKADGTVLLPAAAQRTDILEAGTTRAGAQPNAAAVAGRAHDGTLSQGSAAGIDPDLDVAVMATPKCRTGLA